MCGRGLCARPGYRLLEAARPPAVPGANVLFACGGGALINRLPPPSSLLPPFRLPAALLGYAAQTAASSWSWTPGCCGRSGLAPCCVVPPSRPLPGRAAHGPQPPRLPHPPCAFQGLPSPGRLQVHPWVPPSQATFLGVAGLELEAGRDLHWEGRMVTPTTRLSPLAAPR